MPDLPSVQTINGPAKYMEAVTPNDGVAFDQITRGIYVGGAGNLVVREVGGGTTTFTAVPAGTLLPIMVMGVMATNTTATSIVRLW